MLGETKVQAIAKQTLAYSSADQTEVLVAVKDSGLTRFANSYIHQNVAESNSEVRVRVITGKKIGVAGTNDISEAGLRKVVESAMTIARARGELPTGRGVCRAHRVGDARRPRQRRERHLQESHCGGANRLRLVLDLRQRVRRRQFAWRQDLLRHHPRRPEHGHHVGRRLRLRRVLLARPG